MLVPVSLLPCPPPLPDDVLTKDAGECVICLEELLQGDTIARLPCLCIYHKRYHEGTARRVARGQAGAPEAQQHSGNMLSSCSCIDSWFEVNRSCPEHPSD